MRGSFYIFLMFILIAVALNSFGKQEKRKCLSKHETIAILESISQSGERARFQIIEYANYEKREEQGDPRQEHFEIQLSENEKLSAHIVKQIKETNSGDTVYLSFRHDYVTTDNDSFPQRIITHYKKR